MRLSMRTALLVLAACSAGSMAGATGIVDDFESYAPGSFPAPPWSDVAAFDPQPPFSTLPSARVVTILDAFGNPTQALTLRDENALVSGIYYDVPVSSSYSLAADLRVDRFSDGGITPASDWAMQLTFAQTESNFYSTPQAGVYASSLTGGWRLFLIPSDGGFGLDLDLGLSVTLGLWYRVQFELDALSGEWQTIISDIASGTTLLNQSGTFADWTPQSGLFDSVAFFDGDPSGTIANLAYVDNINVVANPVPEPSTWALLAGGAALLGLLRRRSSSR